MALTRELLKELNIEGLTDEVVNQIMSEHGKTINENKKAAQDSKKALEEKIALLEGRAEISPEDLQIMQTKLDSIKDIDVEDLQNKFKEASDKVAELEANHKTEIDKIMLDSALKEKIATIKFSSSYAKQGVYDALREATLLEDGELKGFDDTLAALREKEPSAFAPTKDDEEPGDEGRRFSERDKSSDENLEPPLIF